jgi:mannose-6-phosphate isomerase-like protein (cupin superfamily)
MKHLRLAAVTALAFGAGLAVAHLPLPAGADPQPLAPAAIDIGAVTPNDLPPPSAASPNMRSRTLVTTEGATVAVQIGTVFKHYHAGANEIQYIVSGGGTEWLGDQQVALHPGLLLIIPAGTPHGGTTDPAIKYLSIKTPPQAPTDTHPIP